MIRAQLTLSSLIFAALLVQGCSTASVRVMPGEGGTHKVVVRDIEKADAEEAAANAAKDYCKDQGKHAVFVSENTKYTGSMDETTRNTVRNASKAASVIGFQNRSRTTRAGQPMGAPGTVETAGQAGGMMTNDKDYQSEVVFKCQ